MRAMDAVFPRASGPGAGTLRRPASSFPLRSKRPPAIRPAAGWCTSAGRHQPGLPGRTPGRPAACLRVARGSARRAFSNPKRRGSRRWRGPERSRSPPSWRRSRARRLFMEWLDPHPAAGGPGAPGAALANGLTALHRAAAERPWLSQGQFHRPASKEKYLEPRAGPHYYRDQRLVPQLEIAAPEGQARPRAAGAPSVSWIPFLADATSRPCSRGCFAAQLARQLARHRGRAGAHRPGRVFRQTTRSTWPWRRCSAGSPVFLASLPRGVPPSAGLGGAPPAVPALLPAHPPQPFRRSLGPAGWTASSPLRPVMHTAEAGLEGRPPRARPPLARSHRPGEDRPTAATAGRATS